MGHYDDCYENTRRTDEAKRREHLLRWIPEKIEEMSNHELEVMYSVAQNVDDFAGFFRVIRLKLNSRF